MTVSPRSDTIRNRRQTDAGGKADYAGMGLDQRSCESRASVAGSPYRGAFCMTPGASGSGDVKGIVEWPN